MMDQSLLETTLELVHKAVSSVCPIDGVAIPDLHDKTSWRIDFKDEATREQRDAAAMAVERINPALDAPVAVEREAKIQAEMRRLAEQSLIAKGEIDGAVCK